MQPSSSAAGSRRSSATGCAADFPNGVLLDTAAHMGRCRNNPTTAVGMTSDGYPIEVSFVLADPPALTRCIISCPRLTAGAAYCM